MTVTPVTYISPDALIFTGVIHKEGDTSDRNSSDIHLHLVIWQTLLSKVTYNWGVHKAIHLEEAIRQRKWS